MRLLRFPSPLLPAALVGFVALASGCGTTLYQPARSSGFEPQPAQISDEDVRRALEAKPQLNAPVRIAYYAFDTKRADAIEQMLGEVPEVERTYRIPSLVVTGERRFSDPRSERRPLGLDDLRLAAARAHCDLLVVFDHGHRIERRANGLAALNTLIVPALFVPFMDAKVESYLDAYVMDVRNGYLYGQLASKKKRSTERLSVWSDRDRRIAEQQWTQLLEATGQTLTQLVGEQAGAEAQANAG